VAMTKAWTTGGIPVNTRWNSQTSEDPDRVPAVSLES
jgi:hypothetical protein